MSAYSQGYFKKHVLSPIILPYMHAWGDAPYVGPVQRVGHGGIQAVWMGSVVPL